MKAHYTILFISVLICISSWETEAQSSKDYFIVSGLIQDSSTSEPLVGVNVYIKGTTTGTVTNENGYYSLKLAQRNPTIVYRFIGYQLQEKTINIKSDKTLNIVLETNEEMLQEISITSQRKFFGNMDYGREIPTVKSEEIEKLNTSNASDILHARLAGVWATKTSGAPGDQQKIRIRGQASFFSSAEPLYVIDGVPVPIVNLSSLGIGDLNMHDIESVTVLKDASSTALYGYQGANGVILIDTKQTSQSKLNISYNSGIQWFNNFYDLMDTKEFLESIYLAKENIQSPIFNFYPTYSDTLTNHDRQKEIFKIGLVNEFQLSHGGKIKSFKYYLSGNYTRQEGILPGSAYKRGTVTARGSRLFGNKLAVDLSYRGSHQDNQNNQNQYGGNRLIFEGINKSPMLESTPDSLLIQQTIPYYKNKRIHYNYGELNSAEPLHDLINNNNVSLTVQNHAASIIGRYQISPNWSINAMESMLSRKSNYNSDSYRNYNHPLDVNDVLLFSLKFTSDEEVRLLNHQINLTYDRTFGLHTLNIVAAHRYYTDNLWWNVDTLSRELPEHYSLRNSMAGYGKQGAVIRKITSYIFHASYNFRETYYLSAVANLSRLKEGLFINYYTLFPSVSLNWNLAKEPFFPKSNIVNELNIYSNYGTSGNYPLNGLSNDIYDMTLFTDGTSNMGDYSYVDQLANHKLRHENTTELDLGFKSSFFKNRMEINVAFYNKKIGNQIVKRNIPDYYGGGEMFLNLGDINVNGYEASISIVPIKLNNFDWYLNGNFSSSSPKVTNLADGQDMLFYTEDVLFPEFIVKEGKQLGDIYGYQCMGKWDNTYEDNIHYAKIGGLAFLNSDTTNTKIDENDKVAIGNSLPDFTWNLSSSLRYKDFSLDVALYSVWGVDKFNATRAGTIMTGLNRYVLTYYTDSIKVIAKKQFYESSLFIDDASFIRLKTVALTYSPHKKIMGMNCDFTISLENFFTFTHYRGYDPEATIYTDNNFSDNAIDKGAYPSPKSVFFKINLRL